MVSNIVLNRLKSWQLLFILAIIQIFSHLPYLTLPAVGNHVWRQCNTLAVARNYAEEDMNILYPRIDKRYHTNGITGPQFTSYDYTLAIGYKIFGFSQHLHRYLSLIISIFAVLGIFHLANEYFHSNLLSFLSGFALIGIPEFYYHSINAVPDLLALMSMIWGWVFYLKFLNNSNFINVLGTVLFLSLAGMTKVMYLMPGFIFLGDVWVNKRWRSPKIWAILAIGLIVLSMSLGWYYWAKILTSMNGIYEFVHEIRFLEGADAIVYAFFANVFSDVPETWVGYGLIGIFLAGLVQFFRYKIKDIRFLLLGFGIFIFYIAMQYQLKVHGYYTLLFQPFVVLLSIWGWKSMKVNRLKTVLFVLLVLSPFWAWLRMNRNWQPENWRVSHALIENQSAVKQLTIQRNRWIVGVDQSGCVDFYYLQAKGFPWYNLKEKSDLFDKFRKDGAEGLITNDTFHAQEYFKELEWSPKCIGHVGEYYWYVFQ